MMRRVASNIVVLDGKELKQYLVEIENGVVVGCSKLTEEKPMTEWLSGSIIIYRDKAGKLRARHGENELR